jgi:hypothetical protein
MAEQELTLHEIVQRLPHVETAHVGADLWPRIAASHLQRQRRRRVQRLTGLGIAAVAVFALALAVPTWLMKSSPAVDWQARAQALEVQLNALAARSDNNGVVDTELARIDAALQSAYDRGAANNELVPLWKQRSDLLGALLTARQQQVTLTRI